MKTLLLYFTLLKKTKIREELYGYEYTEEWQATIYSSIQTYRIELEKGGYFIRNDALSKSIGKRVNTGSKNKHKKGQSFFPVGVFGIVSQVSQSRKYLLRMIALNRSAFPVSIAHS